MTNLSMKDRIGLTAGQIWEALCKKNEISVAQLPKVVKEKTLVIHQALGWLAREDKVEFKGDDDKLRVSLRESERKPTT